MTSISDIRVFLGKEFDNYYWVDDLDSMKWFLCHTVLDRFIDYDPNRVEYKNDYLDMIYSLLDTSKQIIDTIPYNSEYRIDKLTIYIACIYLFSGMLKSKHKDYYVLSIKQLRKDANLLISYGLNPSMLREIEWILSNCLLPDASKSFSSYPFNPGNLYVVSDALKLSRLPIYDLVLTTLYDVYDTHKYNITTYDIEHIIHLVYLRLQSLYGYNQCNHLYLLNIILDIPIYSEYNTLQNILISFPVFKEYISHYISLESLNRIYTNTK